jgi:hypothetical protein
MNKTGTRRRALTVSIAAGVAVAGCLGVVLAESAGAATPPVSAAQARSTYVAPTSGPSSSPAASARVRATVTPGTTVVTGTPGKIVTKGTAGTTASSPAPSAGSTSSPSVSSTPQAQIAPKQLPAAAAENWVPVGTQSTRTIAGHDIGENECAKVRGADIWTQQSFSGGDGENVAIQDTFVFTSADAARSAYQNVVAGMDTCRQTTRALQTANKVPADASVTETASQVDAATWKRNWTGVLGMSADGPQTNHVYLAVNGTRLIVLQFTEFPHQAAPYDTAADPQVLAMLDTELAR